MYADDSQLYIIMRQSNLAKISCPSLTCLNVTQRRPKSFTSPHFLHRPSQFHFLIFFLKLFCLRNESWIHWSFKYHKHQRKGNKLWTSFDLFALSSAFFIFNPGYNLPFILFYHITRNACFIAFPCMLMQIHLNNNDNNNNNNNNKNWINSAIHNCIPINKSIYNNKLDVTEKL